MNGLNFIVIFERRACTVWPPSMSALRLVLAEVLSVVELDHEVALAGMFNSQ